MSAPSAPILAASGTYSPPNTVPVLVSGVDTTRNVTYFAFNVFNTDTKTFSMVNITSSNDNVTSLGGGQYIIYVSTGASVSPATVLVLTLKIAYTDGSVTTISQELSTLTAPEEPDLREACIRLDTDSGYVALVAPSNTNNWTGASAGIVYYTEYVDPSGQTQVESHFTPVEDSDELVIGGVTYTIFPVILVPAETGYIAVQFQYYFNGQVYVGPMSATAAYTDAQTPLPPIDVTSIVTDYALLGSATLKEIGTSVAWLPPVLSEFITIDSYSIYRDEVLIADVSGNVLTYNDNSAEFGTTYVYGVCANSEPGSSTTTLAASLTTPSVVPAVSASAAIVAPTGVYANMRVTVTYPDVSDTSSKYMFGAEIVVNGTDGYTTSTEILRTDTSTTVQNASIDVIGNQTLTATVRLIAMNHAGVRFYSNSVQSNSVSTTVVAPTNVTVTQLDVVASAPSTTVAWTYPSTFIPLEAFLIEYTDNSGSTVLSTPLPPDVRSAIMTNLAVDRTYSYRVIAVATGDIRSVPSAPASITIAPPGAVVGLSNVYTGETNTLVLTWSRAANYSKVPPEYYNIDISNQGLVVNTRQIAGTATSVTINGAGILYPGQSYIITVSSIPYLMEDAPNTFVPLSSSTEVDLPGIPDVNSVVATPIVDNSPQVISVTWSKPANDYLVTQYLLYRQIDGGVFELIATIPNTTAEDYVYTDDISQQPMGQSYVYKVVCANDDGLESTGTNSNDTGDVYYPASAPTQLSIVAFSLAVVASFANPTTLSGGTGTTFTVQLIDSADAVVATETIAYSPSSTQYVARFAGVGVVSVGESYSVTAWLNTEYQGHTIVGDSANSNDDVTGAVPIITDMQIDEAGVISITYVANVLQSNGEAFPAFSAEELMYPIPMLIGSADPVDFPTRPIVQILPSETQIVDGLTVVNSAVIPDVGNEYTITYSPKLITDPLVDVAASFVGFVVSNRYGTQSQLHPTDVVLSSTSQPV